MTHAVVGSISEHFAELEDPRIDRTKAHLLRDILVIAICAVIDGAETWVDIADFGNAKLEWFKRFLPLANGIPSHDTFGRVFRLLDASQFQRCFLNWMQAVSEVFDGQLVIVDGKQLRRSHDKTIGKDAIYMVSAWAQENQLVLGQSKVAEKSNEITAIPQLLAALDIGGCSVTIDAMGCQVEIAKQIVAQGADYVLALKGDQATLYDAVQELFEYAQETDFTDCDHHKTVNKGHGRIEVRECWTISKPDYLAYPPHLSDWPTLRTIVMVKSERRIALETTVTTRYYLSSLAYGSKQHLHAVRSHWGIENQLHWVLDVAFREDDCRVRKDHAPHNFAILRHIALNLLKQEKSAQCGVRAKRLKAGWDENYLLKILSSLFWMQLPCWRRGSVSRRAGSHTCRNDVCWRRRLWKAALPSGHCGELSTDYGNRLHGLCVAVSGHSPLSEGMKRCNPFNVVPCCLRDPFYKSVGSAPFC